MDGLFGMLAGERLSWRGWLGLILGFVGIVLTMRAVADAPIVRLVRCRPRSAATWAIDRLLTPVPLPLPT